MTVEHLASQRGTRLHGETIASIGNLIFASEGLQDKLMNEPFSDKQKILKAQSEIWVPPAVSSAKRWGRRASERSIDRQ